MKIFISLKYDVIYLTRLDNMNVETYIGLTEDNFKTHHFYINIVLIIREKENATTFSEHKLKDKDVKFSPKWKIVSKAGANLGGVPVPARLLWSFRFARRTNLGRLN